MATALAKHEKIKAFDWEPEPSLLHKEAKYPTKYKIPATTRDPFRVLVRDYVAMEEEKDGRQYGSLDVLTRVGNAEKGHPRWMEILKPILNLIQFGEYTAIKCTGMMVDTINNPELRQGYAAQMNDEIRHANVENYLCRYFAKNARNPAGFNSAMRTRAWDPIYLAARSTFEPILVDDPVAASLHLQVFAETAFTNPIFVALTQIAALNGDHVTPTVGLSIQSDEGRHMANGYATLVAVLSEPDNLETLQEDFDTSFWRQHHFIDSFTAAIYDYFSVNRLQPYTQYWDQWVEQDFLGSYIDGLKPFGLKEPRWADLARQEVPWKGHTAAMLSAALWPIHAWSTDYMVEDDFEFLSAHYPEWEQTYGGFWTAYREMADPRNGTLALSMFEAVPPFCRVCQLPCALPAPHLAKPRFVIDADGRRHALCSEPCEYIFLKEPHRYPGHNWLEVFDGWDLADYLVSAGLVRSDGKTLVAQPHTHIEPEWLWTVDHIRDCGIEIKDPLKDMPAEAFRQI